MPLPFRHRLSYRQARNTVLLGLVLGLLFSGLQIGLDLLKERERVEYMVKNISSMVMGAAAQAVYSFDEQQAKRVVDGLLQNPPVIEARIINDFGAVLAQGQRAPSEIGLEWLVDLAFAGGSSFSLPLRHGAEPGHLGILEIVLDPRVIVQDFFNRSLLIIFSDLASNLILACLLTMMFYYLLTKPLFLMATQLSTLKTGRPQNQRVTPPPGHETDELGLLADTVNRLLERIGQNLESLKEGERRYLAVLEANPDPMVVYDRQGKTIYANPAFTKVFGWRPEELVGARVNFVPDELKSQTLELIHKLLYSQEGYIRASTRRLNKSGELLDIDLSAAAYHDAQGRPAGMVVNLKDMTLQNKMEERLRQAQKMEAVGNLAGGVAHDFNNILQAIAGYVNLAQSNQPKDCEPPGFLSEIDKAVQRASKLVQRLLTFSRRDSVQFVNLNPNQLLSQVIDLLSHTIPKMITVDISLDPDIRPISADPNQVEQIFLNLGGNAKDAMPAGGRLLFRTDNVIFEEKDCNGVTDCRPGEFVRIRVEDDGQGMDESTIGHIYEPFFTTKPLGQGTGLGLSTVYGIVKNHGGMIFCNSSPGRGTIFDVFFPALPKNTVLPKPDKPGVESVPAGRELILLVDDEDPVRQTVQEYLGRLGYSTVAASTGEQALKVYQKQGDQVDMVIMDLGMPGMGGWRAMKSILGMNSTAKVLVASGYLSAEEEETWPQSGAAGFIGKPYRLPDLLKKIREILDQ